MSIHRDIPPMREHNTRLTAHLVTQRDADTKSLGSHAG